MSHQPLHVFMAAHRAELLELAHRRIQEASPARGDDEGADGFGRLLDEIIGALQRDAGLPSASPLPGPSEAAARFGSDRQRRGIPIAVLAEHVGAIATALGELGVRHGATFGAREHHLFVRCTGAVLGAALDRFWAEACSQLEHATAERLGYLLHELRNALATARMAFGMLRDGQLAVDARTADLLERSLARLDELMERSLFEAHLRAHVEPRPVAIALDRWLCDVAEATVLERGVRVATEIELGLAVTADERLLASAIGNLLRNAVKFSRAYGTVTLRARRAGPGIAIEVEDECGGLAISPELLFRPHVQAGSDRRGFGLGLAITREAVAIVGGEIVVHDRPGRGCVFCVRIPVGTAA